jgi:hypothetical protein
MEAPLFFTGTSWPLQNEGKLTHKMAGWPSKSKARPVVMGSWCNLNRGYFESRKFGWPNRFAKTLLGLKLNVFYVCLGPKVKRLRPETAYRLCCLVLNLNHPSRSNSHTYSSNFSTKQSTSHAANSAPLKFNPLSWENYQKVSCSRNHQPDHQPSPFGTLGLLVTNSLAQKPKSEKFGDGDYGMVDV